MQTNNNEKGWVRRHPVLVFLAVIIFLPMAIGVIADTRNVANKNPKTINATGSNNKQLIDQSIKITNASIEKNSIGTPILYITIKNTSKKTIDAADFLIDLYNNYDEQIGEWNNKSNEPYRGIIQYKLSPGTSQTFEDNLAVYGQTTKVKNPRIVRVHFTDGEKIEF